jgi:hypothetical protein
LNELLTIDYNEVEIVFRTSDKTLKDELRKIGLLIKEMEDTSYLIVKKSDISRVVDIIRDYRGEIVSIVPKRKTLEDLFIKEINS